MNAREALLAWELALGGATVNKLIVKYAISLGNEWFTGFRYPHGLGSRTTLVGKSATDAKLLDEDQVKLALQDLEKCDYRGDVYEVHLRAVTRSFE